jgi:hypothetical protein
MRYNLFLDDFRVPQDAFHYTKVVEYMKLDWVIARSFDEFVKIITEKDMLKAIGLSLFLMIMIWQTIIINT